MYTSQPITFERRGGVQVHAPCPVRDLGSRRSGLAKIGGPHKGGKLNRQGAMNSMRITAQARAPCTRKQPLKSSNRRQRRVALGPQNPSASPYRVLFGAQVASFLGISARFHSPMNSILCAINVHITAYKFRAPRGCPSPRTLSSAGPGQPKVRVS